MGDGQAWDRDTRQDCVRSVVFHLPQTPAPSVRQTWGYRSLIEARSHILWGRATATKRACFPGLGGPIAVRREVARYHSVGALRQSHPSIKPPARAASVSQLLAAKAQKTLWLLTGNSVRLSICAVHLCATREHSTEKLLQSPWACQPSTSRTVLPLIPERTEIPVCRQTLRSSWVQVLGPAALGRRSESLEILLRALSRQHLDRWLQSWFSPRAPRSEGGLSLLLPTPCLCEWSPQPHALCLVHADLELQP